MLSLAIYCKFSEWIYSRLSKQAGCLKNFLRRIWGKEYVIIMMGRIKKILFVLGVTSVVGISASAAGRTGMYLSTTLNSDAEMSGTIDTAGIYSDATAYVCAYKDGVLTDVQIPQINSDQTFSAALEGLDEADKVAVYLWQTEDMMPIERNVYDFTAIDKSIIEDSLFTSYLHETLFVTDVVRPENNDEVLLNIKGIDYRGKEVSYDITAAAGIWGLTEEYVYPSRRYAASLLNDPSEPNALTPAELIHKGDVLLIDSVGSRTLSILIAASPYSVDTKSDDLLVWKEGFHHSFSPSTRDGWVYGAVSDCYIEDDEAVFTIGDVVWSDDKDRPIPMAELKFNDDGTLDTCSLGTVKYSELDSPESSDDSDYDVMILYTYRGIVFSAAVYRLENVPRTHELPAAAEHGDYGDYGIIMSAETIEDGISIDMFDVENNEIKKLTMSAGAQIRLSDEQALRPVETADFSAICDRTIFAEYSDGLPLTLCRYKADENGAIASLCLAGEGDSSAAVKFDYDPYAQKTSSSVLSSKYFIGSGITEVWAAEDMNAPYAQSEEYYSAAVADSEDYLANNEYMKICFVDRDSITKKPALILRFSKDKYAPDDSIESDRNWSAEGYPAIMVTEVGEDYVKGINDGAEITYKTRVTTSLYEVNPSIFGANYMYDADMIWYQRAEDPLSAHLRAGDIVMVDADGDQINTMLKINDAAYVLENAALSWDGEPMYGVSEMRDIWIGGAALSVQQSGEMIDISIGRDITYIKLTIAIDEPADIFSDGVIDSGTAADIEEGDVVIIKQYRGQIQGVCVYRR